MEAHLPVHALPRVADDRVVTVCSGPLESRGAAAAIGFPAAIVHKSIPLMQGFCGNAANFNLNDPTITRLP